MTKYSKCILKILIITNIVFFFISFYRNDWGVPAEWFVGLPAFAAVMYAAYELSETKKENQKKLEPNIYIESKNQYICLDLNLEKDHKDREKLIHLLAKGINFKLTNIGLNTAKDVKIYADHDFDVESLRAICSDPNLIKLHFLKNQTYQIHSYYYRSSMIDNFTYNSDNFIFEKDSIYFEFSRPLLLAILTRIINYCSNHSIYDKKLEIPDWKIDLFYKDLNDKSYKKSFLLHTSYLFDRNLNDEKNKIYYKFLLTLKLNAEEVK